MGACFSELFPTQVRGTAGGFSYNFGRGVGALVPAGVGMTSGSIGLAVSIGIWAACSYLLAFAVALVLPETRNKGATAAAGRAALESLDASRTRRLCAALNAACAAPAIGRCRSVAGSRALERRVARRRSYH